MSRRMRLATRVVCLAITCAALSHSSSMARGAPSVTSVELPPASTAWAISSRTGGVAVLETGTNSVVLYPALASAAALDNPRRQPVGAEPVSIAYKPLKDAGYFLVACRGDRSIHVLDEAALKPVKVIGPAVGVTGLTMVAAAASPLSPYAYYSAAASSNGGDGAIGRIDVANLANDGLLEMAEGARFEVAVAADGATLYTRRPGTSPMGFFAWRVLPPQAKGSPVRAQQIVYEHSTRPRYVPDPFAQSVACGPTLYTADLRGVLAELPAVPVAFQPDRPVFFGVTGEQVVAMSYNTYKTIGQPVALPADTSGPVEATGNSRRQPQPRRNTEHDLPWDALISANSGSLLIRARGEQRVTVIPLALFDLPAEPFLYADLDGAGDLTIGQKWSAKVAPRSDGVAVEVSSADEGVKLAGNQLQWTPGDGDVGPKSITLRLSSGKLERLQRVDLIVRRPGLALPIVPRQVHASPDGRRILALAPHRDPAARGQQQPQEPAPGQGRTRAVLVDTGAMSIVADRVIPADVRLEGQREGSFTTTVDDERAYLPLTSADAMLVVSMKDLSDVKRVFTPGRPTAMRSAAGNLYVSIHERPTQLYALPAVEPASTVKPDGHAEVHVPVWTGDHWFFRGLLYGPDLREPVMIVRSGLRALPPWAGANDGDYPWSRGQPPVPMPWGVRLEGRQQLVRSSGQRIANLSGRDAVLLADVPAVAILLTQQTNTGSRAEVVLSDLVLGSLSQPFVLSDEPRRAGVDGGQHDAMSLLLAPQAGGSLFAVVGDRLYVLRIDPFKSLGLPEPVWIEPRPKVAANAGGVVTVGHAAHGGKPPLTFALAGEREGITIDAKTGVVTIDPAALKTLHPVFGSIANDFQHDQATRQKLQPAQAYAAYAKVYGPLFESVAGRKPLGVPIAVPIVVKAIDAEQQESRLAYLVPVDVAPPQ